MSDLERDPPDDPLELLVFECLERRAQGGERAVEALLAAHPELAPAARARLELLRQGRVLDAPPSGDLFPEQLGDFKLLERLGSGGMGVVYRARQESLQRDVALKLIRPEHLYFPTSRERFRREALAVARMRHPGIVPIHGVGEENGIPFIAMELVEGESLADALERLAGRDPASLRAADLIGAAAGSGREAEPWIALCLRLARELAVALDHAHARGVLHRDVKPSNVLITRDGRALLLDFGLASLEAESRLTQGDSQPGSLPYMSPEQVRGEASIDVRSDVYSLGVVLYELLTLLQPFQPELGSGAELRRRILAAEPRAPRSLHGRIPRDVETVCLTAMAPERERRYPTAAELAADLGRLLEHRTILARPPSIWLRVLRWSQRHPAASSAVAAVLVLGLATSSAFVWQQLDHASALMAERDIAQERFDDMRALATSLLFELDEAIRDLEGSTAARELIVQRSMELLQKLSRAAENDPELAADMGWAHVQLGDILGGAIGSNLGDPARAREQYDRAQSIYARALAANPNDRGLRTSELQVERRRAMLDEMSGANEDALARYQRVAAEAEELAKAESSGGAAWWLLASVLHEQASALTSAGRFEEAWVAAERALAMIEAEFEGPQADQNLDVLHGTLSRIALVRGDLGRSELHAELALEAAERMVAAQPNNASLRMTLAETRWTLSKRHSVAGRHDSSLALARAADDEMAQLSSRDPDNIGLQRLRSGTRQSIGIALLHLGRAEEARDELRQALEGSRGLQASSWDARIAWDICTDLRFLAQAEIELGELASALCTNAMLEAEVELYFERTGDREVVRSGESALQWSEKHLPALARPPGATEAVQAVVADYQAGARASPEDAGAGLALAVAELYLGRVATLRGERELALCALDAALGETERLAAQGTPSAAVGAVCAQAAGLFARQRWELGDMPGALEACRRALHAAPDPGGDLGGDPKCAVRLSQALSATHELAQCAGRDDLALALIERLGAYALAPLDEE